MVYSWKRKVPGGEKGMIAMEKWLAIRQLKERGFGKRRLANLR